MLVQSVSKFTDESNAEAVKELVTKGEVSFSEFAAAFSKSSEVCSALDELDFVAGALHSKASDCRNNCKCT